MFKDRGGHVPVNDHGGPPVRLFATLGSGDIVGAHRLSLDSRITTTETSLLFSEQLVEWCKVRSISLLGVGHHARQDAVNDGKVRLEQGPKVFAGTGSLRYHLGAVLYAMQLAIRARRFGAHVALIDSGTAHYFALLAFRFAGIAVAVNLHNVLWAQGFRPKGRFGRIIACLNGWFFRRHVFAVAGCSPECGRQVNELAGKDLPFFEWRAQFVKDGFPSESPVWRVSPFRMLYSGRVEANKGVLDLPAIAAVVESRLPGAVRWDVCGDGGALQPLRAAVAEAGLQDVFTIHGRLARDRLLAAYGACHAMIVPTRGGFSEGMPLVCAEAVISGRPVVTSRLSNALPVLGAAIAESEPEVIQSFARAVEKLVRNEDEYERRKAACPALADQFFDPARSYPAAVDRLLTVWRPKWQVLADYGLLYA